MKGSPDPPAPYGVERVFPKLTFNEPVRLVSAPGTSRLFVVERYGKIYSFPNDPAVGQAELVVDLGKETYGLAFHPQFRQNGYIYVTYIAEEETKEGSRLVRFQLDPNNPVRCDRRSETLLLTWPSGGHNGGCILFGPDGYLYLGTGDGSGIADELDTGQDLSDLLGSVIRIDVDAPDVGKAYGVPKDNPFVGVEGAQPEIWAYGLRQPWDMSFDRATGDLWVGNVGQDLWEQIYRIESGGNYGWSVTEGGHPFRPERKRGPSPILPPVVEHDHAVFRSITGGFVYRGERLAELAGHYIYGDYDTGKVWALRWDGQKVVEHQELVDSTLRIVDFGQDQSGEVYLVDHVGGGLHWLLPSNRRTSSEEFPRRLSQTGLFRSTQDHKPAPGLIPYSVVAPAWTDGAHKERYLALPGDSKIELDAIDYPQPAPGAAHGWKFPDGTVLMETIWLEMEKGNPASRRRLETRLLHHERLVGSEEVGDQYWQGYSYVWNDDQTDAVLLESPQGLDRFFTIRDSEAPGGQRRQTWHFPSRAECTVCHNMAAKYALGITTLQMNKEHDYGGVLANQLRTLQHLGIFQEPLSAPPEALPRLVDYRDSSEDLNQRARSYLHANCSHCHRKWGGGNADFQLLYSLELADMGISQTPPGHGTFSLSEAMILAPGAPHQSVLPYRMASIGQGRMPRIGSNVVDERGLSLIVQWIEKLERNPKKQTDRQPSAPVAADATKILERVGGRRDVSSTDRADIDQLLASTTGAMQLLRAVDEARLASPISAVVIERGVQSPHAPVRDLFERFVPEQQRTKRLGSVIDPNEILALPGDVAEGKRVYFDVEGVQCKTCHKVHGTGGNVGPDLSEIGKKYNRAQMLETILQPSKEIDPKYVAYLLETTQGQIHTGLLVAKTDEEIVLIDAQGNSIGVPADNVERLVTQSVSLMPELLLRDMTARQVADLTEYLSSLK